MKAKLATLYCGIRQLNNWQSLAITLGAGFIAFVAVAFLQNRAFVISIAQSALSHKCTLIIKSTFGAVFISPPHGILVFFAALLFGLLIATYRIAWKTRAQSTTTGSVGGIGALIALLGLGCAACGPTIIASLVALLGGHAAAAFLTKNTTLLFGISIGILLLALMLMFHQIGKTPTCNIDE